MPAPNATATTASLSGVVIEHAVARQALNMSRDAFYAAMRKGEIPCRKIGGRWFVMGEPFRRMVGLAEAHAEHAA